MSSFKIPPPWQSDYAIPGYVRAEGLQSRAFVTKWAPRGTYDDPDPYDPSWDKALAIPQYIKDEGYGQGAMVTEQAPRRFYVGATRRIKKGQKALGEYSRAPASVAGRITAGQILAAVYSLPPGHQKMHLRAMLDAIDPKLWGRVAAGTQEYIHRGASPRAALELALARGLAVTTEKLALGETVPTKAISIATGTALATKVGAGGALVGTLEPGACSSDGKFIWERTPDGTGYWRRLAAGEQCRVISTVPPPAIRTGGGGISVTPTTVMKIGPFTIPVVRPGKEYTWGLDDYAKLTPEQATMIKEQLKKRIDYPGRSNWVTINPGGLAGSGSHEPGTTSSSQYYASGKPTVKVVAKWPALAPWGQTWLTLGGWMRKLGFAEGEQYEQRYMGFDRSKYTPIATFMHPDYPEGGVGVRYGLWLRIEPVGPQIPAESAVQIDQQGVATPSPGYSTVSQALQFMVAPLPGSWRGDFWDWIMKYVKKLVVGFYDALQDVAQTMSNALCAMALTPGSVEAAAATGGPAAAAAAAGSKLLLGGKCGQPLPPGGGEPARAGWLLPLAIGGGILAVGLLFPSKKRKAP
jgi:hypothetical protein